MTIDQLAGLITSATGKLVALGAMLANHLCRSGSRSGSLPWSFWNSACARKHGYQMVVGTLQWYQLTLYPNYLTSNRIGNTVLVRLIYLFGHPYCS